MNPPKSKAPRLNISQHLALWSGKVSGFSIRFIGVGLGSSFPGRLALMLAPSIFGKLVSQARLGIIAVTGTNGKSTTAGLFSSILSRAALKLVHNRQGANLKTGITSSLIDAANLKGAISADYFLFEVDEAVFPKIAGEADLNLVIVTNLFRDQLDRFGELDTTRNFIEKGIRIGKTKAVLNADDPNVSQLSSQLEPLYFGIESIANTQLKEEGLLKAPLGDRIMELSYCASCKSEINYATVFYAQLGHWRCVKCERTRPKPQVYASNVDLLSASSVFNLVIDGRQAAISLSLPGLFNVYNALAAAAAASWLNIPLETIADGLKSYTTLFGRSERLKLVGKNVLIQLIKNPAGASQAISAVSADGKARIMIAINDNAADGRDVSWLWDADFEELAHHQKPIIVSGRRAKDMAVRMKYAGFPPQSIVTMEPMEEALRYALAQTANDETLWILPTYTCLLSLQKSVKKLGATLSGT